MLDVDQDDNEDLLVHLAPVRDQHVSWRYWRGRNVAAVSYQQQLRTMLIATSALSAAVLATGILLVSRRSRSLLALNIVLLVLLFVTSSCATAAGYCWSLRH